MYHIDKLQKQFIPILLTLEASGFRISDVLSLKVDCVVQNEHGWWLVGDQRKVRYKEHKVPITEEIAKIVLSQQALTREISTKQTNPNDFLFPMLSGKRKGMPITSSMFISNLNKFAYRCNILDTNGEIYWFRNHAFRHRYGVNLINNGMNILHVQKLLAHASPEMTLVYARIFDNTLRTEWEKARENGALRFSKSGNLVGADLNQQAEENGLELEWIRHNLDSIRLDHGFCVKSPKLQCDFLDQTLEPPCIKNNCRSFHVDQSFLSYYEEQIKNMESDIEIYKKTGRTRSVEIIQPKLTKYKEIANDLSMDQGMYGLPKEKREYVGNQQKEMK
ncbi:tyrosine-type recombinase/integrase [Halobacillus shinanisalinarum]|uniref:Tyrosine-type recombinase/integrase n=1 Tax=Halobacillus shinanisalinarum TaxID=2932258 RepID=A0ABY4GWT4_9BACI|nr:tyrosine-type recombinase/integrase [Halobacillus shinanisalinarum]UOQ92180.1 tyrosine-type recombinase/integrase [Halobacillus shinanisalinarum]